MVAALWLYDFFSMTIIPGLSIALNCNGDQEAISRGKPERGGE
jgi:hypothetical protein